eukprot:TRINITY_DN2571_c0_g1_i2.p1 TRINITY_DN2571_c0_g1~~TRINITY_DN2571_c0_g1_i2.p1  ORF type:complete len:174 (+),score=23.38 TRINITY_DN2571_c0_g1_i2:586-1107(+)
MSNNQRALQRSPTCGAQNRNGNECQRIGVCPFHFKKNSLKRSNCVREMKQQNLPQIDPNSPITNEKKGQTQEEQNVQLNFSEKKSEDTTIYSRKSWFYKKRKYAKPPKELEELNDGLNKGDGMDEVTKSIFSPTLKLLDPKNPNNCTPNCLLHQHTNVQISIMTPSQTIYSSQ